MCHFFQYVHIFFAFHLFHFIHKNSKRENTYNHRSSSLDSDSEVSPKLIICNLMSNCCLVKVINGSYGSPNALIGDNNLLNSNFLRQIRATVSPTDTYGFSCPFYVRSLRVFFIIQKVLLIPNILSPCF